MKIIGVFRPLTCLVGLSLGLLISCDDKLSNIGEGIQARSDVVESEQYDLVFEASTIASDKVYNGMGTAGLLGAYYDEAYGSFSADFVSQIRTAPGFTFSNKPKDGAIDSVELRLTFLKRPGYVGSTKAPLQVSVYEAPKGFKGADYSSTSLNQYADESRLLGEKMVSIERDTVVSSTGVTYLPIKLKSELGQRIYQASLNNPAYFQTQDAFNQNLLGGLYVTVSTGRGLVVKVDATDLVVHYRYDTKTSKGADTIVNATETFINTRLTPHADGISNSNSALLLGHDANYTYSKGPAGVLTAITLPKAQMERLLAKQSASLSIGTNLTLADTQLKLTVDNPSNLQLNPPEYMMLMPKDSVETYFKRRMTERTQATTSYLSTPYKTTEAFYDFYNISRMITEHLKHHAKYVGGKWTVAEDLELRLLPVQRITRTVGSSSREVITTEIHEYLFPSFVRIKKDPASLKIPVVLSIFR